MNDNELTAQLTELVKAAISGDNQAQQSIKELATKAESDPESAQKLAKIQEIYNQLTGNNEEEGTQMVKCGGKVRAKIKAKACGGDVKKEACGGNVKKDACGSKVTSDKCGGKTKKVKKGENGVVLPEGSHGKTWTKSSLSATVFSKGGRNCPCQLKRVGGQIVEIDGCTGLPIHKNDNKINYIDYLK